MVKCTVCQAFYSATAGFDVMRREEYGRHGIFMLWEKIECQGGIMWL